MFEFHLDFEMMSRNYQMRVSQTLCAKTASVMNLLVMIGTISFGSSVSNAKDGFIYVVFVVTTMPKKNMCVRNVNLTCQNTFLCIYVLSCTCFLCVLCGDNRFIGTCYIRLN